MGDSSEWMRPHTSSALCKNMWQWITQWEIIWIHNTWPYENIRIVYMSARKPRIPITASACDIHVFMCVREYVSVEVYLGGWLVYPTHSHQISFKAWTEKKIGKKLRRRALMHGCIIFIHTAHRTFHRQLQCYIIYHWLHIIYIVYANAHEKKEEIIITLMRIHTLRRACVWRMSVHLWILNDE